MAKKRVKKGAKKRAKTASCPPMEGYPFLGAIRHQKKRKFLVVYCETGNISETCRLVGIYRCSHYQWMATDPDYADAFQEAKIVASEALEAELTRRAYVGVRRLKFYQGQPIMIQCGPEDPDAIKIKGDKGRTEYWRHYVEHEFSDTLGMFLLKAMMPEKYRERFEYRDGDREINETIARELEALAHRAASGTAGGDPKN